MKKSFVVSLDCCSFTKALWTLSLLISFSCHLVYVFIYFNARVFSRSMCTYIYIHVYSSTLIMYIANMLKEYLVNKNFSLLRYVILSPKKCANSSSRYMLNGISSIEEFNSKLIYFVEKLKSHGLHVRGYICISYMYIYMCVYIIYIYTYNIYIYYIYIYINISFVRAIVYNHEFHTHTHTYIYIYIFRHIFLLFYNKLLFFHHHHHHIYIYIYIYI
jgi:hypothetical protein